jgi:hypothetical protein
LKWQSYTHISWADSGDFSRSRLVWSARDVKNAIAIDLDSIADSGFHEVLKGPPPRCGGPQLPRFDASASF